MPEPQQPELSELTLEQAINELSTLRRVHQEMIAERTKRKAKITELEATLSERDRANTELQQTLAASELAATQKLKARDAYIGKTLLDSATSQIATAVTGKPENAALLMPHIVSRFEVVSDGDLPVLKIKDKNGAISEMTLAELQSEVRNDPRFSTVVVISKASGAGGSGGNNGGAGGSQKKQEIKFGFR